MFCFFCKVGLSDQRLQPLLQEGKTINYSGIEPSTFPLTSAQFRPPKKLDIGFKLIFENELFGHFEWNLVKF
jgi:hypothetical protein